MAVDAPPADSPRSPRARAVTDVALVTYEALPDLDDDDRPLVGALAAQGLSARPVVWSDPTVDWSRFGAELVVAHDVLVQPLVPALAEHGDRSLVFFDGVFSHAVARRPGTAGRDLGRPTRADDDELAIAERTLVAARDLTNAPLLYARVD